MFLLICNYVDMLLLEQFVVVEKDASFYKIDGDSTGLSFNTDMYTSLLQKVDFWRSEVYMSLTPPKR